MAASAPSFLRRRMASDPSGNRRRDEGQTGDGFPDFLSDRSNPKAIEAAHFPRVGFAGEWPARFSVHDGRNRRSASHGRERNRPPPVRAPTRHPTVEVHRLRERRFGLHRLGAHRAEERRAPTKRLGAPALRAWVRLTPVWRAPAAAGKTARRLGICRFGQSARLYIW